MQLSTADWIPGCCQFFEKRRLEELLALLAETYEVRYCEDFAETIALLDGDVHHLHRPILPVSYTHLDVYKRQYQVRPCLSQPVFIAPEAER